MLKSVYLVYLVYSVCLIGTGTGTAGDGRASPLCEKNGDILLFRLSLGPRTGTGTAADGRRGLRTGTGTAEAGRASPLQRDGFVFGVTHARAFRPNVVTTYYPLWRKIGQNEKIHNT